MNDFLRVEPRKTKPGEKLVRLPKAIDRELLDTAPEAPLGHLLKTFTDAGLSADYCRDYQAALQAMLTDRPTVLGQSGSSMNLRPDRSYFGIMLNFPEHTKLTQPLDFLPPVLKPQLQGEGQLFHMTPTTVRGAELADWASRLMQARRDTVLAVVKRHLDLRPAQFAEVRDYFVEVGYDAVSVSDITDATDCTVEDARAIMADLNTTLGEKPSALETWLAQVNRLEYSLHESMHVLQSLTAGDQLNRFKQQEQCADLMNPAKERLFAEYNYPMLATAETLPRDHASTLLVSAVDNSTVEDAMYHIIPTNEATMDMLVSEAVAPLVRKHPALALELHNAVVTGMAALEALDPKDKMALKALRHQLALSYQLYFAAFPSTADGETWLRDPSHAHEPILRRNVSGLVATTGSAYTELDCINRLNQVDAALLEGHEVPEQLRAEDVAAGVAAVLELVKQGLRQDTLLQQIDHLAGQFTDNAAYHQLPNLFSTIDLDPNYPMHRYYRRLLLQRLREEYPEEFARYVRLVDFCVPYQFDVTEPIGCAALIGGSRPDLDFENQPYVGKPISSLWDQVKDGKTVGVVDLDVTALTEPQQAELRDCYFTVEATPTDIAKQQALLKTLVKLKREQLKTFSE